MQNKDIPVTRLQPRGTEKTSHRGRFCYVRKDGAWRVYDVQDRAWLFTRPTMAEAENAADAHVWQGL